VEFLISFPYINEDVSFVFLSTRHVYHDVVHVKTASKEATSKG
jgi:hypothetical protein